MTEDLTLRVHVQDVWDEVHLEAAGSSAVGDVKRRALRASRIGSDPAGYVVKFRGAELADGSSLRDAGVVTNASLIVFARRRRPVR